MDDNGICLCNVRIVCIHSTSLVDNFWTTSRTLHDDLINFKDSSNSIDGIFDCLTLCKDMIEDRVFCCDNITNAAVVNVYTNVCLASFMSSIKITDNLCM